MTRQVNQTQVFRQYLPWLLMIQN